MTDCIQLFDDFLSDPDHYRTDALRSDFKSFHFENCTFHGIAIPTPADVPVKIRQIFPGFTASLSFFRKSPRGQVEPHFIHTDIDMGKWSALLYLNPDPPPEDGTAFWTHKATGAIGSDVPHERSEEGRGVDGWLLRRTVHGKFNRLVIFPSHLFHSRAIHENWGDGDGARLTQVVFGQGELL